MNLMVSIVSASLLIALAAQAAEPNPVRIGVINDGSGIYADLSGEGSKVAAQMAVEDFGGSLFGRKIEILYGDDESKPDIGVSIVRKWLDTEGVSAIADGGPSSVAVAIQELSKSKPFVYLNSGGYSSILSGPNCTARSFHFAPDTRALSYSLTREMVGKGLKTWFFVTADYAFGHALEADASRAVEESGGQVLGQVRHPQHTMDFSSYLLRAQASGANAIAFADAGDDLTSAIKQAHEFGIGETNQKLIGYLVFETDVIALGPELAQGLRFLTPSYWDMNDGVRAWAKRFMPQYRGKPPTTSHIMTYSAVMHFLKAANSAGTLDADQVAAKMRAMQVDDPFTQGATIQDNGRVLSKLWMVEAKKPSESKYQFDNLKVLEPIDPKILYQSAAERGCQVKW